MFPFDSFRCLRSIVFDDVGILINISIGNEHRACENNRFDLKNVRLELARRIRFNAAYSICYRYENAIYYTFCYVQKKGLVHLIEIERL